MHKHMILFLMPHIFFISLAHPSYAAPTECELSRPVVFAGLDWDSARFHNAVAGYLVEKGYHCAVDEIPGSTIPLLTAMVRGNLDIMMEVWKANIKKPWQSAVRKGKVAELGVNVPDPIQGWFVPRYLVSGDKARGITAKAPDLKHVKDLKRYAQLFQDPENPSKGRFYNCILGWFCEITNTKRFKAYGLEAYYTNMKAGTAAALDAAIASHYKRGQPFVSYYWGPTWIMGTYDLVKLEEMPFNQKSWDTFLDGDLSKVTALPPAKIYIGATTRFMRQAPRLSTLFQKYQVPSRFVSQALAFLKENRRAKHKDAAILFLKHHSKLWHQWLPADEAKRVQSALDLETRSNRYTFFDPDQRSISAH